MVTLCLNENKLTANEKSCNTDEGQQLHCSAPRWPLWGYQLRPGDDVKVGTPHLQPPHLQPPHLQPRQIYGITGEQVFTSTGSERVHPGAAPSGHMNERQQVYFNKSSS